MRPDQVFSSSWSTRCEMARSGSPVGVRPPGTPSRRPAPRGLVTTGNATRPQRGRDMCVYAQEKEGYSTRSAPAVGRLRMRTDRLCLRRVMSALGPSVASGEIGRRRNQADYNGLSRGSSNRGHPVAPPCAGCHWRFISQSSNVLTEADHRTSPEQVKPAADVRACGAGLHDDPLGCRSWPRAAGVPDLHVRSLHLLCTMSSMAWQQPAWVF